MIKLDRLLWMKCVNRKGGKVTYPGCKKAYAECFAGESFDLHWPNYKNAKANASKLSEGDQIVLVQHDRVTHIIELLGTKVHVQSNSDHPYSREGKVIWYDNNYDFLFKDVMGFKHRFTNGLALDIPHRRKFQHRWGTNVAAFQRYVAKAISAIGSPSQWESDQEPNYPRGAKNGEQFRLPEEIDASREHYEGNVDQILVNRYERDPAVRKECIAYHGTKCSICKFDFVATYGEFMRGFIHVHHLKSLAQVGKIHKVDPIKDLRPVCPNCHAAIHHRLSPPYSILDIKKFLRRASR
jgi:hypothetical protein